MLRVLRIASDEGIVAWGSPTRPSPSDRDRTPSPEGDAPRDGRALAAYFLGGGRPFDDHRHRRQALMGALGGLAAAGVVLLPQLAPTMKLPAAKSLVLLGCGVAAAGGFGIAILSYIGYALDITRIYTILFDLGFVAALVLLWLTWTAYNAGQGASAPPSA